MMDSFSLLIVVVILAVAFDMMNGFHDAANAIATSVSTRVLTPRVAIVMAAILNFVGALTGTAVAATVGKGLVDPQAMSQLAIASALLSAFFWDLITWHFGLPTSSSHALMA
ncbi:MAG TPA: inorganic phosphate transporter, partial [candidate division Zixibacteria bacterium]|nr:inorganic phosphate transporter [candidate division Zixibacteria bacterium]